MGSPDFKAMESDLFASDVMMPSQYFDAMARKSTIEPERKLLLAVLIDAINCWQHCPLVDAEAVANMRERWRRGIYCPPKGRIGQAAEAHIWIFGGAPAEKAKRAGESASCVTEDSLFSFASVCESLGINPQWLRVGLRRWRERRETVSRHRLVYPGRKDMPVTAKRDRRRAARSVA